MLTKEHIDDLLSKDGNILSADGDKIGSPDQIYADDGNGRPTWVTVRTGLFGTSESFIPLEGARLEGSDIVVPYTKDQVKDAPGVETDGHLEPSEEDRLYEHYQPNGGETCGDTAAGPDDVETGGPDGNAERDAAFAAGRSGTYPAAGAADTVGHDTSGHSTDVAITRSEDRLGDGTQSQATGKARLRKYMTTKHRGGRR